MITIIDYNAGNLQSVFNAVSSLGHEPVITGDHRDVRKADVIILPGVGSFSDCFENLRRQNMIETLNEMVLVKKRPFLGICIGLQLLARKSYEFGEHDGLGWVDGEAVRIDGRDETVRIPHMGWNSVDVLRTDGLLSGFQERPSFYFVHSFYLKVGDGEKDIVTSTCRHGDLVTASVRKGNIFGVQFHPEKSQDNGLRLFSNFFEMAGY